MLGLDRVLSLGALLPASQSYSAKLMTTYEPTLCKLCIHDTAQYSSNLGLLPSGSASGTFVFGHRIQEPATKVLQQPQDRFKQAHSFR